MIHIIDYIYITFGFLLPTKYSNYHIYWCVFKLLLLEIIDYEDIYDKFINDYLYNTGKYKINYNNINIKRTKIILIISLSIYNIINPTYSFFNIIKKYV